MNNIIGMHITLSEHKSHYRYWKLSDVDPLLEMNVMYLHERECLKLRTEKNRTVGLHVYQLYHHVTNATFKVICQGY